MQNLHDLFEHEMKDAYDAECRLIDALRSQAAESTDPEIRAGFQAHLKQTEKHKERLERVFEMWAQEPSRGPGCAGVQGLLEEHKEFKREKPAPAILDIFNLTLAAKVERYEITAYESLIRIADQMGLEDAIPIFEKTLEEEEATLDKVTGLLDGASRFAKVQEREPPKRKAPTSSGRSR